MKNFRLDWRIFPVVLASVVFLVWSCGGGGGGETTESVSLTPATLDQASADNATAMALSSSDVTDISDLFVDDIVRTSTPDSDGAKSVAAWVLDRVREGFLSGQIINERDESRAAVISESGLCDGSGSFFISGTWTGPNNPSDISEVSDVSLTMTFSTCVEYGQTINGAITVKISGNLSAPTGISVTFSNVSMTDTYSDLQFSADDLEITMTGLQYAGGDLTHVKVTLDGDIDLNSNSMEFYQFSEDVTYSGSTLAVTISGSLTASCLDGWVTFTTLEPVQGDEYSACPFGGSVQISGDIDMVVTFHADGSVTIGDQEYLSCNDIPNTCR